MPSMVEKLQVGIGTAVVAIGVVVTLSFRYATKEDLAETKAALMESVQATLKSLEQTAATIGEQLKETRQDVKTLMSKVAHFEGRDEASPRAH